MMRGQRAAAFVALALALGAAAPAGAQSPSGLDTLRRQCEQRFDVLPLRDGIALHPKSARASVRSIEITGDSISVDGAPATGAELRDKLGADADLILRLSYLDADARRALAAPAPRPPEPPRSPEPPSAAEAPPAGAPPAPAEAPAPPVPRRHGLRVRHSDDRVRIGGRV